jgi:hypothetical protein
MKKFIRVLFINFIIFLFLIIIIELIFGGWFSDRNRLNNLGVLRNIKVKYRWKGFILIQSVM